MKKLVYILLFLPLFAIGQTELDGVQNGDETGIDCGGSTGVPCVSGAALLAVPGAEGAGKYTRGARAATTPTVYVVTNTNFSGAGSLLNGLGWNGSTCEADNVIIVFQTGGNLDLGKIEVPVNSQNITIYGQTAPSDSGGFHINNGALTWRGDQTIVQGMHFALGDFGYKDAAGNIVDGTAALQGTMDALGVINTEWGFFDRNAVYFGVDENMSVSTVNYVTMSNNLVAYALFDSNHYEGSPHSMGGLINLTDSGGAGGAASYIKNYFAHNRDRNLRSGRSIFEMHNNIFYDFYGQSTFGSGQTFSAIGNHWQKRAAQDLYNGQTIAQASDATHGFGGAVYFSDNTRNHSVNVFIDADYTNQGIIQANPEDAYYTYPSLWSSTVVQDSVFANVGPYHRTSRDQQVIDDFAADTGQIIDSQAELGGFETVAAGTPWTDSDADGLDDAWETATFGDLDETATGDTDGDGYLNVEEWAHSIIGVQAAVSYGYTVTPTSGLTTTEAGGTDTFDVVLNELPASNVVFDITSNDTGEGTVSASTLTFTTGNWSTPQTITVTGVDDGISDGNVAYTVTVSVNDASSDDNYDPLADTTVNLNNTDNDSGSGAVIRARGGKIKVNGKLMKIRSN